MPTDNSRQGITGTDDVIDAVTTTTDTFDWINDIPEMTLDELNERTRAAEMLAEVRQMEMEIENDNIRHRDEQLAVPAPGGTLRGGPGYARAINAARVQTARNSSRNKIPKRAKSASGPQYNRIRSTSTL